ncbi:MAG: class I SAM-dependent methyltransferase [Halanaerobium sp.]|nr:class I SAM-dependent methyltransferase [Halanaerobium sp.]
MPDLELTARLQAVADLVPEGSRVADIGTDHGLLPVYLMVQDRASYIVATDVHHDPLNAARKNVSSRGLEGDIELRQGWGLDPLEPGEVDTLVISGLGGNTILEILDDAPDIGAEHLILQPVQHLYQLRCGLAARGFAYSDEALVKDEGKYYTVISGRIGSNRITYSELELRVGPVILEKRPPILGEYLQEMLERWEKIIRGLANSKQPSAIERYRLFQKLIAEGQEVLACLQ